MNIASRVNKTELIKICGLTNNKMQSLSGAVDPNKLKENYLWCRVYCEGSE